MQSEFAYDRGGRLSAQRVVRGAASGSGAAQDVGLASPTSSSLAAGARGMSDIQGRLKGVIERHYHYDPSGQLVQWLDRHRGLTRYGYDAAGRITQSQIGLLKDWGATGVRADAAGNGTGHPMAANEQFHWDAASNPLPAEAESGASGSASFVRGNRLEVWQDARYTYDEHGNLIERLQGKRGSAAQTRTLFRWDAAHQLVWADVIRGPDHAPMEQTFGYAYDALGRRVAKRDAFGTTQFAWDGDRMALEQRGGNEIAHLYHPESFVPLAQIHDGRLHHLHTDHLGTPLEASNDEGETTWRVTYRAWGTVVVEQAEEIQQRVRLPGQYLDAETGLHYNRFRYYEPRIGRFISQDPIGLAGGLNSFSFAPNPINWTDVLGLKPDCPCAGKEPASVEDLISMMNKRANTKAEFATGDMLRYLNYVQAEASHMLLEDGTSHIVLRKDVSTRWTALHEWLHRCLQRKAGQARPGEDEFIEKFLARHQKLFRIGPP